MFSIFKVVSTALAAMLISISIVQGLWYLPGIVLITVALLLWTLKKRVSGIVEDERDRKLAGKSALIAMSSFSVGAAVIGTTCITFDRQNPLFEIVGNIILCSGCILVIIYSLLYTWYARHTDKD